MAERGGVPIIYAEVDGIPVCIVDGRWCEREAGHEPPHVFQPEDTDPAPRLVPRFAEVRSSGWSGAEQPVDGIVFRNNRFVNDGRADFQVRGAASFLRGKDER